MTLESKLAEFIDIKSPGKLEQVVNSLNELIRQGAIKEVAGNCMVTDLIHQKTLPDFIEIDFIEYATNYRFRLAVETYHGSGGFFKRQTD